MAKKKKSRKKAARSRKGITCKRTKFKGHSRLLCRRNGKFVKKGS